MPDELSAAISRLLDASLHDRTRCLAGAQWPSVRPTSTEVRPWRDEMDELQQQMRILRSVAKRYHVVIQRTSRCGSCDRGETKRVTTSARTTRERTGSSRGGTRSSANASGTSISRTSIRARVACSTRSAPMTRAGSTPTGYATRSARRVSGGSLGPLGESAHEARVQQTPKRSCDRLNPQDIYYGRDWRGAVAGLERACADRRLQRRARLRLSRNGRPEHAFSCCWVHTDRPVRAYLNLKLGRRDGRARGGHNRVQSPRLPRTRARPRCGRNRYHFEERVPVDLPAGATKIAVTEINAAGLLAMGVPRHRRRRVPIDGVRFTLGE